MSTTNAIKLGTQRVSSLEQTRGAKCSNSLHIQFPASTDETIEYVPADAPTVIRVESRGQTSTAILQMYPISKNLPQLGGGGTPAADYQKKGCPSKFHILHYFKNGAGTDTLKVGWSFVVPGGGGSSGGALDIDVSGVASGEKTVIVIMWDGQSSWRATNWFA